VTSWSEVGADGLWLPEPPPPLRESLRKVGDQRWGTRERAPALHGIGWFAQEFERGANASDYVLAGREDAATNRPAVQYLLAFGALGLFIEGDVFEARGRKVLEAAGRLQHAFITAVTDQKILGRLIVLDSDFGTRGWKFLGEQEVGGIDGITGALDWLTPLIGHAW
jgi:hypothetical protein